MTKETAREFYKLIKHHFDKRRNMRYDGMTQFLITFYYLANGNFQYVNAHLFHAAQSSYSDILKRVILIIASLRAEMV